MNRAWWRAATGASVAVALALQAACVSVEIGGESSAQVQWVLHDGQRDVARRPSPVVDALLIQPQPAGAVADALAIAYSRRDHELAYYQLASWTERPVRRVPRLVQQRLEARGVAGAVGLVGDPLRADWLLTVAVDTLHHDLRSPPGAATVALTADLFDRRTRTRVAHRRFEARVPAERADSAAAAKALSQAVTQAIDELAPWAEIELERAVAPR